MTSPKSEKAPSRPRTPGVSYRHNVAAGRHEIGVKIEGAFVPFATLDDPVVAQRLENAANAAEAEEADEDEDA